MWTLNDDTGRLTCPFIIAVDSREQAAYHFKGIRADANHEHAEVDIGWQWQRLETADYSILGLHDQIGIERKSLEDLFGTLGQRRRQFEAEFERLSQIPVAHVVIEASLEDILLRPPVWSRLNPKAVVRTMIAWQLRYPTVHWWLAGSRRYGELITFRLLEKFFDARLRTGV